jgi:prophage tail gpP-like protein
MANIVAKNISAGTATILTAEIAWQNVEDINTWVCTYQYKDAAGNVIKTVTQPIPAASLGAAGMTMNIANNIKAWIVQQAAVTVTA